MEIDPELGRRAGAALVRWLRCVAAGGHDFQHSLTCVVCGADKYGPSLKDLILEAKQKQREIEKRDKNA